MVSITPGTPPALANLIADAANTKATPLDKPEASTVPLPLPVLSPAESAGAAGALARLPDLVLEPALADSDVSPTGPKLVAPEISEHTMSMMELVHTIRKSVGEMRALVAKEVCDAAKAEKVLIEKRQQMMRLLNNPPTPEQRRAIDTLQATLQRQLMALENVSLHGGGALNDFMMDRVLTDMADTLLKLSDLTQGSLQHDRFGSLYSTESEVREARSLEKMGARMDSDAYRQDLKNYADSEKKPEGLALRHDNAERVWKMHQEGGYSDAMFGSNNHFAVIRATQASQDQIQVIVNTLLDDILPPGALGEIQQGLAMLSAFNSADLALLASFQDLESGGADRLHPENGFMRHQLHQLERDLSDSIRDGRNLKVDVRDAHGATVGRVAVSGKDMLNFHASQLVSEVRQAAENLKKEIADLVQLEQGIADLEKALAELLKQIDIESNLINGQFDSKQLAAMSREWVQQSA